VEFGEGFYYLDPVFSQSLSHALVGFTKFFTASSMPISGDANNAVHCMQKNKIDSITGRYLCIKNAAMA